MNDDKLKINTDQLKELIAKNGYDYKQGEFLKVIKQELKDTDINFQDYVRREFNMSITKANDNIREADYVDGEDLDNQLNLGHLSEYPKLPTKTRLIIISKNVDENTKEALYSGKINAKDVHIGKDTEEDQSTTESQNSVTDVTAAASPNRPDNANFDFYEDLAPEDRNFLNGLDKEMWALYRKYTFDVGELLNQAQRHFLRAPGARRNQDESSSFEKWFTAWGFSKNKAYDYIRQYEFVHNAQDLQDGQSKEEFIETFNELPAKAKTKIASKSVDPEFRELVMSSNITQNAQYKRLLQEFDEAKKRLTDVSKESEQVKAQNQKLQTSLTDISMERGELQDKLLAAINAQHSAESKVNDLESDPVTVEVEPDDYQQSKRELEQATQELQQRQEEVASLREQLANAPKETEEKVVAPEDYEKTKADNARLQEQLSTYEQEMEKLKKGSAEYAELKAKVDEMHQQQDAIAQSVGAFSEVVDMVHGLQPNLNQISIVTMSSAIRVLSQEDLAKTRLPGVRDEMERLLGELNQVLSGDQFVDGDFEEVKN